MGVWSDVVAVNDQFYTMVGDSSGRVQFRSWHDGDQQLISQVSFWGTAAQYRMAALGDKLYAIAQVGDRLDECGVICSDGKSWNSGDGTSGVNCVGLRAVGGQLEAVWVRRGGSQLARMRLSADLQPLSQLRVEACDPTSQGFLQFEPNGDLMWTDGNVPAAFGRAKGFLSHTIGPWSAFQEDGHPERVSAFDWADGDLYLVTDAHTEAPPRVAVIGDDVLVAIGGHDWFVHRKHFKPWTPPNTAPVPTPVPEPSPMPTSQPSHDEILAAVRAAKSQLEAAGVVFSTQQEMVDYYAVHQTIPNADKRRAFEVTKRAAWALAQTYPDVGLEAYGGPSAVDGYSFDIILLGKSGPSADVMGAGVTPQALIEENPASIPAWTRDWRPVVKPSGPTPTPTPEPLPAPAPLPTPGNTDAIVSLLNELNAKMNVLAELAGATADAVQEIRERPEPTLPPVEFPEYETRIFGSSVTLRPKR